MSQRSKENSGCSARVSARKSRSCSWPSSLSCPPARSKHRFPTHQQDGRSRDGSKLSTARDPARIVAFQQQYGLQGPADEWISFRTQTGGFDVLSITKSEPLHVEFVATERSNSHPRERHAGRDRVGSSQAHRADADSTSPRMRPTCWQARIWTPRAPAFRINGSPPGLPPSIAGIDPDSKRF